MGAKLIRVIETDLELRGEGTKDSVSRRITQYYAIDGTLLAERDPCPDSRQEITSLRVALKDACQTLGATQDAIRWATGVGFREMLRENRSATMANAAHKMRNELLGKAGMPV